MNQTMEVLIGISNQTGMQLNELVNTMTAFYMYNNMLWFVSTILATIITGFCTYKILTSNKDDIKSSLDSDVATDFIAILLLITIVIFVIVFLTIGIHIFGQFILNMMFPKEALINDLVNQLL